MAALDAEKFVQLVYMYYNREHGTDYVVRLVKKEDCNDRQAQENAALTN